MASVYDDIRQALEVNLNNISGIPDIAWENTNFEPSGSDFVRPMFSPTNRQPAVRGTNPQQLYTGVFMVDCFTPADQGPNACDTLANLVIENFDATTDLSANSVNVSIRSAQRRMGMKEGIYYMIPVVIDWYTYET